MSRLKKGQKVVLKAGVVKKETNGIVVDVRVTQNRKDDKRVDIRYVVEKADDGWNPKEKFVVVTKDRIEKVVSDRQQEEPKRKKPKYCVVTEKEKSSGRSVTVAGMAETVNEGLTFRRLRIGYAIQHPDDEADEKRGAMVAKRRCVTRPMSAFISPNKTEFREDIVEAICRVKLKYICDNIETVIKGRKGDRK